MPFDATGRLRAAVPFASARLMVRFGSAVGAPETLTAHCAARQVKYLRGLGAARAMAERQAA